MLYALSFANNASKSKQRANKHPEAGILQLSWLFGFAFTGMKQPVRN
jgi:hypothetical protein